MVADILPDPAAFHHYTRTRAAMHSAKASTAAEADALGAYLIDRLRIVDQSTSEEAARVFIGYSCESLNDFYTRQEIGLAANKPTAGVPEEVIGALTKAVGQPGWVGCVDAVMMADSSLWKKWKRFRAKHRRGGTFLLNGRVSLVALPGGDVSLERGEGTVRLEVAAR
jgi:hypothetical protein